MIMFGTCFSKINGKVRGWYRYYIFFSWAALFMFGLILTNSLVQSGVANVIAEFLLIKKQDYFFIQNRPYKGESLPKVTTIVNVLNGISSILTVIFAHFADNYIGWFGMIVISSLLHIMGLVLFWFLADSNDGYRRFYVLAMIVLISPSGVSSLLRTFLADQLHERESSNIDEEDQIEDRANVWWYIAWASGSVLSFFWLLYVYPWKKRFMISALMIGASLWLFSCGFKSYYRHKPEAGRSAPSIIFRVFKAAVSKRHLSYPSAREFYWQNTDTPRHEYYYRNHDQILLLPKVPLFTWLDKAAVLVEQENLRNRCLVEQVSDVKRLLTLIPLWITFFAYSMVGPMAYTIFILQITNLNDKINDKYEAPIGAFFVLKSFLKYISKLLFSSSRGRQNVTLVRIGVGMVCSILCCVAAWQVEVHRLKEIKRLPPTEPYATISMSILWLLPQFLLLGLMEGFADEGLQEFFDNYVITESMRRYGGVFTGCILGFGNFYSIPFVLLITSWFKDTTNESRLDKYFLTLAILCSVFLYFYVYVSTRYVPMEAPSALPTRTRSSENEMVGMQMQPRLHVDNPESRYAGMKPLSENVESTKSYLPTITHSSENEMVGMQPRSHVDNPESSYARMKPLSEDVESEENDTRLL